MLDNNHNQQDEEDDDTLLVPEAEPVNGSESDSSKDKEECDFTAECQSNSEL